MEVETVRVKSSHPDHEQGFFIINKSDFDEAIHELWLDEVAVEAKRAEAEQAAAASRVAQPDASTATSSMSGKVTAPRR